MIASLKRQLIEWCATYDRGFGASTSARQTIDTIVQQIQSYNTTMTHSIAAAITMTQPNQSNNNYLNKNNCTIIGNWRMIYTTAFDVLSLQASPFFITGAIYQVFAPSTNTAITTTTSVTNIIDFIPRFQSLLPSSFFPSLNIKPPNTLIRAKVQTRACLPQQPAPNRIGLIFDSVSIQPIELLGIDSSTLLPPLAFDLPKLPSFGSSSGSKSSSSSSSSTTTTPVVSPGYFDVTYLDEELLIIQQNAPGGIFCLLRTNSIDP